MTIDGTVQFFRRRLAEQFRATARVERPADGPEVFDPVTGTSTPPAPTLVYEGPCNIRDAAWEGTDVRSGEREIRLRRSMLSFPHDTAIQVSDVVVVLTAPHDSSLVGEQYRLTDVFLDAWQTVRRGIGEKVSRGPEDSP